MVTLAYIRRAKYFCKTSPEHQFVFFSENQNFATFFNLTVYAYLYYKLRPIALTQ